MAHHLVQDDDAAFRRFAQDQGLRAVQIAFTQLRIAPEGSRSEFAQVEATVAPYLLRVVEVLSNDFHFENVKLTHSAYLRRPLQERVTLVQLYREQARLNEDTKTSVEEKARLWWQLIEACKPYADSINLGNLYGGYADLLPRLGRRNEMPLYLKSGIQAALANHDYATACQLLGTLGAYHQGLFEFEAMRVCWDQALALARQVKSWHEARILGFYARHYQSLGQLALARDLLLQAEDRCRVLGAVDMELRFLVETLQLFASLECWDVVGRGLQRAELLLRRGEKRLSTYDYVVYQARVQELRARALSAEGKCAEAEEIALDLARRVATWQPGPARGSAALGATRALLDCARPSQALKILERVADDAHKFDMPELLEQYSIDAAEAYFMLGDLGRCQKALDDFLHHTTELPSSNLARNRIRHDALAIRVAQQTQGDTAALERLEIALDGLQAQKRQLGASPEATIALAAADDICEQAHRLLDDASDSGYALEMAWRRSEARRTDSWMTGIDASALQDESRRLRERLAAMQAIHCVYDVQSDSIVRWTATSGGIRREILVPQGGNLQARVAAVRAALTKHPSGPGEVDAVLSRSLHELAQWLLPAAVLDAADPSLVLVSADGFLSRLPFEVLNLSSTSFLPLLARHDVAYLRFFAAGGRGPEEESGVKREPGRPLVLSEPAYPVSLRRRYSILTENLEAGRREAELFAQLLPQPLSFAGAEATKSHLLENWERAPVLYFAGHVIQDPETPYIVFIPMAQPASGRDEDAYLEVAEVRQADLSGCDLVVLSGCASGAPYVSRHIASPSLGEAFVDAGARAVIGTSWNIRDDAAARVMHAFARAYARSGAPIAALCEARRGLIREDVAPHVWAAYSITLGGL